MSHGHYAFRLGRAPCGYMETHLHRALDSAGAVIQNKAGAYTQLQEGSSQNKRVTGTGLKGLLVERPGSFAAAPYLLRR